MPRKGVINLKVAGRREMIAYIDELQERIESLEDLLQVRPPQRPVSPRVHLAPGQAVILGMLLRAGPGVSVPSDQLARATSRNWAESGRQALRVKINQIRAAFKKAGIPRQAIVNDFNHGYLIHEDLYHLVDAEFKRPTPENEG